MSNITENLNTPIKSQYDVIVAGAGPAGVCAAIAAGRQGAKTLLLESCGCLGGVWTAGLLTFIFDIEKDGIGLEIIEELKAREAYVENGWMNHINFTYDPESMKVILEKMCLDAGVDIQLHTRVVAAECIDGHIRSVITESKSGREAWQCKVAIDTTGDGDLGALAGCGYEMGSEEGGVLQPMTFMGTMVVNDHQAVAPYISMYGGEEDHGPSVRKNCEMLKELGIKTSYGGPTLFHIHGNLVAVMINHEYGVDATDARQVTEATIRARAEVNNFVDALSKSDTVFKGCRLATTADYIGVREGRRIHGLYTVSTDDLIKGRRHEDSVCRCRFNVDVHAPSPEKHGAGNSKMGVKAQPYDIPVGAIIAKDVKGLLMAGRCISGDWIAHSSYRVTGESVSLGEAAGALAALSAKSGRTPDQVPFDELKPFVSDFPETWVQP